VVVVGGEQWVVVVGGGILSFVSKTTERDYHIINMPSYGEEGRQGISFLLSS
jgi:hypothetical protein